MSTLAAIRADSVNLPLFLHVLGAMLLTGTLLTVAMATVMSHRSEGDAAGLRRFGLKTVVVAVLPAYLLMRVGAQWTESEENLPKVVEDSAWLGIGYIAADVGALLIIVAIVLAAIGLRRMRASDGPAGGEGQARAVAVISILLLVAYVVAIWAMSTKPD
jgi:uncharacterized membrane protein YidH (DUF202 family)